MHDLAREIITGGEIGEIKLFKGCQHVDMFGDPLAPFMWRADGKLAPTGIVGDTGSHVFSFMEFLVGRVSSLVADNLIVTPHRPVVWGAALGSGGPLTGAEDWAEVTNPDATHLMCRFENGASGIVDFSRVATGRKMGLGFEISGTMGSIVFTQERLNELLLYRAGPRGREGFVTIMAGSEHGDYGAFCPASGHQLGYNDLKTIEVKETINAVLGLSSMAPSFRSALAVERVADAIRRSSREGVWTRP